MIRQPLLRNIILGLIDGITIPFALAAGLTAANSRAIDTAMACLAVGAAGAITMAIGAFLESRKYPSPLSPRVTAAIVGLSYFGGGVINAVPFYLHTAAPTALTTLMVINLPLLLVAGYADSTMNGANGYAGAIRVALTAVAAAGCAYAVAMLFR